MIERTETGDAYVGSSIQGRQRKNTHYSTLRRQKHHCRHLQNAWNKYGETAFVYSILETFVPADRSHRLAVEVGWAKARGTYNVLVPDDRSGAFAVTAEDRLVRSRGALERIAADPTAQTILAARGDALAALARTPAARDAARTATARRWSDPAERAALAKGLDNRWADPKARERQAQKLSAYRGTPEARAHHSALMKALWADPEKGAKIRARKPIRWADPEAKERQAAKMRAYHAARRSAKTPS